MKEDDEAEEKLKMEERQAMDEYMDTMAEQSEQPIYSQPQIAKEHLKVTSKISDKEPVHIPIEADKNGNPTKYRIEWKPKYKELLTDDMAKAFLSSSEKKVAKQIEDCCITIKAFANSNELDLKRIYDSFAEYHAAIINTSRAHEGKSAYLSQSMFIEQKIRREYAKHKPTGGLSEKGRG